MPAQGAEIDNPMNDIGPPIIDEDASQPFSSTSTAVIGELASSKQNSFADAWGKNKKVTKFDSHAVAVGFAAKLKQAKKHAKELKDNPTMKALEMKQKMEAKRVSHAAPPNPLFSVVTWPPAGHNRFEACRCGIVRSYRFSDTGIFFRSRRSRSSPKSSISLRRRWTATSTNKQQRRVWKTPCLMKMKIHLRPTKMTPT